LRKCPTDTVYGKEDTQVLTKVLNVSDIIGWMVLPVLCAGIYFVYRLVRKKAPPRQITKIKEEASSADAVPQSVNERSVLTDEYCKVCKAVDAYRDRDVYRDLFSKVGIFIQLLLGSRRRWLAEGNPEELLQALENLAKNLHLPEILTAEGFQVAPVPSDYDEESLRRLCEKAEIPVIQTELRKQKRWLQQYMSFLDCKAILNDCALLLYQIMSDVQSRDARECFAKVQQLERFLQSRGCYPIFYDDSSVAASEMMRVDFREDNPWATELPGLYTKNADGTYHRIGALGGTVRRG